MQTDELLLGDLIEGEGIEVGQRIGDRQRQANLLFDKGSAIGAGNRLAAREEGEIAALATILYQVLLQEKVTFMTLFSRASSISRWMASSSLRMRLV